MMSRLTPDSTSRLLCERVAELRKRHRFTLEQLATASGVSRSMLSQIERGHANPTLAVAHRIAQAFDMSIGELVDSGDAATTVEVVKGDDPSMLFRADELCQIRTLSPLHLEKHVEFYELTLQAGASLDSAAHFDGTRELFTVAAGLASVRAGRTRCELGVGDSAHYRADVAHSISNRGSRPLRGYLVVTWGR
jgi:transcriptional regulator with XRE-family HTH domain